MESLTIRSVHILQLNSFFVVVSSLDSVCLQKHFADSHIHKALHNWYSTQAITNQWPQKPAQQIPNYLSTITHHQEVNRVLLG